MKPSAQNDYLCLLRCALWDVRPDLEHIEDWNGVLRLAQRQTTLGIVGNAALQSQATQDLLPESRVRLLTHLEKMQNEAEQAEQLLMALDAAFSQHDLSFFLLKGIGLAAFYPVPRLRKCGDVDLLVAPTDFDKAVAILNGIATAEAVKKAFFSDKHYHIIVNGIAVELHHRCMTLSPTSTDAVYQDLENKAMRMGCDDFTLQGTAVRRPEPTFNAFYVFLHLWEHFKERGIGLRQVCDWTLLLHARKDQIDSERLKAMLDSLGLMKPWQVLGSLAVDQLGLPEEEMPFYEPGYSHKSRRLLRIILKEGNFGKSRKLRQHHVKEHGLHRRINTLVDIQVRAWRMGTVLPKEGLRLWKQKMKGGMEK